MKKIELKQTTWSNFQIYILYTACIFMLLWLFSFSIPHDFIPQITFLRSLFEKIAVWEATSILGITRDLSTTFISDATILYLHVFNLIVISNVSSGILLKLIRNRSNLDLLAYILNAFVAFYLALMLLIYGLDKVFKVQFYMPEPNTLYTPMGKISKDLLYWSVLGASHSYNIFLGLLECLAALLLLWRRTRILGALFSLGLLLNILAVNLSFNISVKLFVCFLLLLSLMLILPKIRILYDFFILEKSVQFKAWQPSYKSTGIQKKLAILRILIIAYLFFIAFAPYFISNNFNDDVQERPFLHGAYAVEEFVLEQDTIQPIYAENTAVLKAVYIHRQGYLILEDYWGRQLDYELLWDQKKQLAQLKDCRDSITYQLDYQLLGDSLLYMQGELEMGFIEMTLRPLAWRKLPLLQEEFNWTLD